MNLNEKSGSPECCPESHIPFPVQQGPEVVEWKPLTQCHSTVSPTWIVTMFGEKLLPPCPTFTVTVIPEGVAVGVGVTVAVNVAVAVRVLVGVAAGTVGVGVRVRVAVAPG